MMSWDIKSGYRQFYLHPSIRDFFLFQYAGSYYRCIALPFGWGRSVLCLTKVLHPLVRHMRRKRSYRVLPYIDDFLVPPSPPGRAASEADCVRAQERLTVLSRRLGVVRHPDKGCWRGAQSIHHLGIHLDTVAMRVYVSAEKVDHIRALATRILLMAQRNRRLVPLAHLKHF